MGSLALFLYGAAGLLTLFLNGIMRFLTIFLHIIRGSLAAVGVARNYKNRGGKKGAICSNIF